MVAPQTEVASHRESGKADVDAIKGNEKINSTNRKTIRAAKQLLNNRLLSGSQRFMLIRRIDTLRYGR